MKRLATESLEGSLLSDWLDLSCALEKVYDLLVWTQKIINPFDVGSTECYKRIS